MFVYWLWDGVFFHPSVAPLPTVYVRKEIEITMSMKENLEQIKSEALAAIAADGADLEALRVKYLGKKGELTAVLRGMGQLSAEERPIVGQMANDVRADIENALASRKEIQAAKALEGITDPAVSEPVRQIMDAARGLEE